jgi:ATP-binding cassette subfamily F protein 3
MEQYEVRGALGLFLFTGDEVFAPISTLSGGEKGRVALTELMLRKDNVLLLDEPTNHLDMDSREVLEDALSGFPGTIISVSHDRYFINRFAEKVWVLDGNEIKEYLGNYDSYALKVSRDQAPDGDGSPQQTRTALDKEKRKSREEERKIREQKEALKAVEQSIARAEKDAGEMEAALADPEIWKDPEKAAETTRQYNALKDEIERLYEQYDAIESAL